MSRRRILIVFCLAVFFTVSITGVIYAGTEHSVIDTLDKYMQSMGARDYQVSYENGLAVFTIYSKSSGYTTWQDSVCETNAYDAVRQESIRDKINAIRIRIIDSQSEVVYDSVNDHVNETVRTIKSINSQYQSSVLSNTQNKIGENSVLDLMNATVITEADRVKLKNTIIMDQGSGSDVIGKKLSSIIEELRLLTPEELGGVSQVEITIQDQNGCVMAYYVADYEFGLSRCWTEESIDMWTVMHG